MVSRRPPRELERYVFSPGGRSDSRLHAGGEEGLLEEHRWEGVDCWVPWGENTEEANDDINDSGVKEDRMKFQRVNVAKVFRSQSVRLHPRNMLQQPDLIS